MSRPLMIGPVFMLLFVFNPAFFTGCGGEEEEFTYGEADMLALAQSLNATPLSYETDEGDFELELDLHQGAEVMITRRATPSVIGAAYACADRNFVRSAAACTSASFLGLEGTLTVRDADGETVVMARPVTGYMAVHSLRLDSASISLTTEAGPIELRSADAERFVVSEAAR